MAQTEHIQGVVIRVHRENDVRLTLLTPSRGKIYVIAKGARSLKGPQMPLSQLFAYGDFEVYRRGDTYWLNTGELQRSFRAIGNQLDTLNLASYFCEVANLVSDTDTPAEQLMRLLLNCLHTLEKGSVSHAVIKGVFEWRVMALEGIFPALRGCMECATDHVEDVSLDVAGGGLLCPACRRRRESLARLSESRAEASPMVLLTPASLQAIRFSISTPPEKMFSFRLEDTRDEDIFTRAGELFLRYHLEAEPTALQMYHRMKA